MSGHGVLLLLSSPRTAQIERPCPDRDYDPKLFENAFLVNYGAWLYTTFALPLIYLLNSGTPILERGQVDEWIQGVESEHLDEY